MQPPAMTPTIRSILSANINLTADEVIRKALDKGVKASDKSMRDTVYNIKSELRRKGAKPAPAPAAARETKAPKPTSITPATPANPASSASDLSAILANVALVNTVVGTCGGIDQARQVAEAVRSCGSVEAFLQHLEVVAQVRGAGSAEA